MNPGTTGTFACRIGSTPDKGVPDMTCISDIDENGINRNLKVRYERDQIYVSFSKPLHWTLIFYHLQPSIISPNLD
ncbi:hypothetical protein ZHAS_00008918 [Anopheles sinensis]|uniref:Uncharacterized protein n=1 Tax=Anopheles sinensis TaxID=74873 RepID=A0A084VTP4_ANOSI|nr:hypothetical protein ZHAS_00008918 [Anopheles sinensis]